MMIHAKDFPIPFGFYKRRLPKMALDPGIGKRIVATITNAKAGLDNLEVGRVFQNSIRQNNYIVKSSPAEQRNCHHHQAKGSL
jgi:hypothetical protein